MPHWMRLFTAALLIVVVQLCCLLPVFAAANEGDFGETHLGINNDWIIYIDVDQKQKLFSYPGSKLKPVTNLRVSYRKSARTGADVESQRERRYEDLWYHNGQAMGIHRFENLGIAGNTRGSIFIRTGDGVSAEPQAVANAIVRLNMDLLIRDAVLTTVLVPRDVFREMVTAFGHFNFFAMPEDAQLSGIQTSLYLVSNPIGMDAYLYYRKKK